MKDLIKFLLGIIMLVINFFSSGCAVDGRHVENKEEFDMVASVAVYQTEEKMGETVPVGSPLLEETVRFIELVKYSEDDLISVPFRFADAEKFASITTNNIGRRLALAINGEVVNTPVVNMPIEGGACVITFTKDEALKFLPAEKVNRLIPE